MLVYLVTNLINGKIYVGQTCQSAERRWYRHVYYALRGSYQMPLHAAIRKYGSDSFKVEELTVANSPEELNNLEMFHIARLRSNEPGIGYNLTEGGNGMSGYSRVISEEMRKNMSDAAKGRKLKICCKRGHLLEGDNVYIRPSNGVRQCKACVRLHQQEFNERRAA